MNQQGLLALAGLLAAASVAVPARAGARDYLPDSTVLARIEDRVVTVARFVDAYFASDPEFRPQPDSLGRVKFLESLVNQNVLGHVARRAGRTLTFEDRLKLREIQNRTWSNMLYQRAVLDSVVVTDRDIARAYDQCKYELRLQEIVISDGDLAGRVYREVKGGTLAFADAARRYSESRERASGGELGWVHRLRYAPAVLAPRIFDMKVGTLSEPMRSRDGYHIVRVAERRAVKPGAFEVLRKALRNQLTMIGAEGRAARLQRQMAAEIGLVVDTANVRWAAGKFVAANELKRDENVFTLELSTTIPDFGPADSGRVLARWNEGQVSLRGFMNRYSAYSPLARPNINDYALFREQVISMALEPYMAVLAVRRGIDQDPVSVAEVERKEEQILVEHLYEDSVASRIWIRPEQRREYYEKNRNLYVTFPEVRFASMFRSSRAGVDSVSETLRTGGFLPDLIRADSLAGHTSGTVQSRSAAERGTPYYKIVFEELRPGEFTVTGPDKNGDWAILQLLEYTPERQLPYEQVEHYVDESLTNIEAEKLLDALIARHRAALRIESHPEHVMRVHLIDPVAVD